MHCRRLTLIQTFIFPDEIDMPTQLFAFATSCQSLFLFTMFTSQSFTARSPLLTGQLCMSNTSEHLIIHQYAWLCRSYIKNLFIYLLISILGYILAPLAAHSQAGPIPANQTRLSKAYMPNPDLIFFLTLYTIFTRPRLAYRNLYVFTGSCMLVMYSIGIVYSRTLLKTCSTGYFIGTHTAKY